MYLVKNKLSKLAHLWNGKDTWCRLFSTGGLKQENYKVVEQNDLPICTMCDNKYRSKQN